MGTRYAPRGLGGLAASRRIRTLATLILVSLVAGTFWVHRVLVDRPSAYAFEASDLFNYWYPATAFLQTRLRAGEVPLWNPNQFAGTPFLALQNRGALYPPTMLLALLCPTAAHVLAAHAVFHLIVAGFFTALFARRIGLSGPASAGAALAFMLSTETLHWVYVTSFMSTLVWAPAILWAMHGLVTERRVAWAVALALTLSMAFLGGFVQGWVYTCQFASVYGFYLYATSKRPQGAGPVMRLAALSVVMTVGLTAVLLLPALELTHHGTRTLKGVALDVAAFYSLPPSVLVHGLAGDMLARVPGLAQPRWENRARLAVLTVPLVLLGVTDRRRRRQWVFFLVTAVATATFLLGGATPVFRIYFALPFGSLFRAPIRAAFLYVLSAAVLAGIGIDAGAALVRRWSGSALVANATRLALVLFVGMELYCHSRLPDTHPILAPSQPLPPAEAIEYLQQRARNTRVFVENGDRLSLAPLKQIGMMNGLHVVPDSEPQLPAEYESFFAVRAGRGFQDPWHGELSTLDRYRPLPPAEFGRLLDLMSVRYYVGAPWLSERQRGELRQIADGPMVTAGTAQILERRSALPRAYVVHQAVHEPDVQRALAALRSPAFDPRQQALVSDPIEPIDDADSREAAVAHVVDDAPEGVEVDVQCASACFLVLTDLYYPGWEAAVDGGRVPMYRTNVLFRGVRVPNGRHLVRFTYRPLSFRLGAWLTLITVCAIGTAGLWHTYRMRAG